ncbi:Fibrocystin-L [Rhizoclosmatium sp. JEL0117]|nr:Fibrocystin-L [Rhizoclosmatium sp. JEL0117]
MYYVFVISIAVTSAFTAPSPSQSGDSVSGYHQSSIAPLFKTTQADPKKYSQYIGNTTQNHWSEVVTFPRPDTSNVWNENSAQDECPHRLLNLKRWESNDTWPNGVVPSADGTAITIPSNTSVLISSTSLESKNVYGTITITYGSNLVFDDANITLQTTGILVDGGAIWMGSETCRLKNYITVVLHGKKPVGVSLNNVPEPSLKGIAVINGGTLDVHGMVYAPAWTRLAATSRKGDKQILIQDIVNWEVGQTIIITTTATKDSRDFNQNDIAVIEDIEAAQNIGATTSLVTIKEPLLYDHYGGPEYQAEVGLLSRRIVVKGDSKYSNRTTAPAVCVGDDVSEVSTWPCGAPHGYGGHIIIVGTAIGRVSGVELIRMVSNNVAYDITGNCFYIEDGIEEDNVFAFNLASHIHFLGDATDQTLFGEQYLNPVKQDPVNLIAPTDLVEDGQASHFLDYLHRLVLQLELQILTPAQGR